MSKKFLSVGFVSVLIILSSQIAFAAGPQVGTNGSFVFDGATIYVTDGRFVDDRRGSSSTGISGYINLDGTYTLDSQAFADALHIPISGKAVDRLAFQGYSVTGQTPVVVHQVTSTITTSGSSQVPLKHPIGMPSTMSNLYTIPQNFDYSGGSGIYTPQGTELSKQSFADFFNSNPTNEEVYTYGLNLGLNQYQMSNALAQWLGKTYYGSITVPDAAATIGGSAGGAGRTDSIYVTSGTGAWGSGACGGRGWGGANWSVTDGFGGYGACKTLANITNNTTTSNTAVVSTTSPNANLVTTQTPLSDAESDSNSCLVITTPLSYQAKDSTTNGFVTKLQDFLHATSYLPSLSTGFFGAGTFKAVKAFQGANGISQTGSVGPNTRAKIKEISCAMQGAPLTDNDVTLSDNITFSNLPAGCTSSTTFSPTTGGRCVSASLPEGCTSNTTFSPVTGVRCVAQ